MRPDGTRVKNASAIVSALPYIMPRRYDAHDYITEYAEMEPLRRYIQSKRREGVRISYMALILAAYFKAYQQNPKINRFIMNSKIYQRNHFCVSFVILKTRADGTPDETSVKIFFEDGDDVISINRKIEDAVALNQKKEHNNSTDRFANFMFSLPVLPTLLVGLVKLLDRLGLLPRFVIDLRASSSPTSPASTRRPSTTTATSSARRACSSAWASPFPTSSPANTTRRSCRSAS